MLQAGFLRAMFLGQHCPCPCPQRTWNAKDKTCPRMLVHREITTSDFGDRMGETVGRREALVTGGEDTGNLRGKVTGRTGLGLDQADWGSAFAPKHPTGTQCKLSASIPTVK